MEQNVFEIVIASVAGLFAVILGWRFLAQKALERRIAKGLAAHAEEILIRAIDQRGSFMIEFPKEDMPGRRVDGIGLKLDSGGLYIDIGRSYMSPQCVGDKVMTFFQFRNNEKVTYHQFETTILKLASVRGVNVVQVAKPKKVESSEKRFFLRVSLKNNIVIGLGIWLMPYGQPLAQNPREMPRARYTFRPGRLEEAKLVDISAAGIRIHLSPEAMAKEPVEFEKGSQLLLLLMLREFEGEKAVALWLATKCVACDEEILPNKPFEMRMKFFNWAVNSVGENLRWFPVGQLGEVPPLATWIMRYDLYRSKMR